MFVSCRFIAIKSTFGVVTSSINLRHVELTGNQTRIRKWCTLHCYTSTQNTCTRLVQIASREVFKYALFTNRSTNWPKIILILPSRQY